MACPRCWSWSRLICALAWAVALAEVRVEARVGEARGAVEARLLAPNTGARLASPLEAEVREQQRGPMAPFLAAREFFPPEHQIAVYWKSAVERQLSRSDGWEVTVVYTAGMSVLEVYKRVGARLNDFEVNGLLSLHRGGSNWERVEGAPKEPTVIGFGFKLADGSMRAVRRGDWLMIYATKLDAYAVERRKEQQEQAARDALEQRARDAERVEASLAGF